MTESAERPGEISRLMIYAARAHVRGLRKLKRPIPPRTAELAAMDPLSVDVLSFNPRTR